MKSDKPFLERLGEIYSLLALPVDVDILCYTPEEFEKIKDRGFFKKLIKEEVVLYRSLNLNSVGAGLVPGRGID